MTDTADRQPVVWLDVPALKAAGRVAVVAPSVLAVAFGWLDNSAAALFAVFGTFALLVFADFGGQPSHGDPVPRNWLGRRVTAAGRTRVRAHAALAAAGFPLIVVGTLCSRQTVAAICVTAVVAFTVLFAGTVSGRVAAAAPSALLAFVLPVMIPASASELPSRLGGWALASAASLTALVMIWPSRPNDRLREKIADSCRASADLVAATPTGAPPDSVQVELRRALEGVRRAFLATPYRPTGNAGPTAALARLVDDVNWLARFALPWPPGSPPAADLMPAERTLTHHAVAAVLRAVAGMLVAGDPRPRLAQLEQARTAVGERLCRDVADRVTDGDGAGFTAEFTEALRLRLLAYGARQAAVHATVATGGTVRWAPDYRQARREFDLVRSLASYATTRAVWMRNTLRGTVGLTAAVAVAQLADLDNGFWVVLGTLSVLRSNALQTGSTVLRALLGTAVGILAGVGAVTLVDGSDVVSWLLVPVVVLVAAYAPRAVSFAVGQAGFTVFVLVLFDLLSPTGDEIALVRLTDVAVGCAVSLVVGALFWPRGAGAVVREHLAGAYSLAGQDLAAAVADLTRDRPGRLDDAAGTRRAAVGAGRRLDDAVRQYLSERSTNRLDLDHLATLAAGATRIRASARLLREGRPLFPAAQSEAAADTVPWALLETEVEALQHWYDGLAVAIETAGPPPLPDVERDDAPGGASLRWVRHQVSDHQSDRVSAGLPAAWAGEYLHALRTGQHRLVEAASGLHARRTTGGGHDIP